MRVIFFILTIIGTGVCGCMSAYKNIRTPDDVYYSTPKTIIAETYANRESSVNNWDYRDLRMLRYDRRWHFFNDDFNYRYDPYRYGFDYGYYYNPFYYPAPVYLNTLTTHHSTGNPPRRANLNSYQDNRYKWVNPKYQSGSASSQSTYNNVNQSDGFNRRNIPPGYNSSSQDNQPRSYNPPTGNSSSGNSSSGNSNSISRPARGN